MTHRPALLLLVALASACPRGPVEDGTNKPDGGNGDAPATGDPVEEAAKLIEKGDLAGAEAVIDKALGQHEDNHELWFAKGVVRQGQNDDAGAEQAWNKALELRPEFVPAIHGTGAIRLAKGDFDAAIDKFTQALRLEPDFADAHYNLGLALLGNKEKEKAIQAFERAVKLAPNDATFLVQLADMYVQIEKPDSALPLVKHAQEVAPDLPTAYLVQGHALVKKGDFEGAIVAFTATLKRDPDDLDARLGLARAQQRAGKLPEAAKQLELLSQAVPDSNVVWAEWGSVLAKQGDLPGALAKFDKALAIDPKFEAGWVRKIGALAQARKCKEAKAALGSLRDLEPAEESMDAGEAAMGKCKK
ncbi:MAG TPA: tetratricopeptide repeat protein [Nannocystaceae bacterium]|nr:tetratricopeptide repeat protein [Nannocystaceae bacterium]